jgi:hypothetical protein
MSAVALFILALVPGAAAVVFDTTTEAQTARYLQNIKLVEGEYYEANRSTPIVGTWRCGFDENAHTVENITTCKVDAIRLGHSWFEYDDARQVCGSADSCHSMNTVLLRSIHSWQTFHLDWKEVKSPLLEMRKIRYHKPKAVHQVCKAEQQHSFGSLSDCEKNADDLGHRFIMYDATEGTCASSDVCSEREESDSSDTQLHHKTWRFFAFNTTQSAPKLAWRE